MLPDERITRIYLEVYRNMLQLKMCPTCPHSGFEISLIRSSEMSKNDSQTSGIPARLVQRMTAYFWFSHKLHWLCIFQTSEWYIRTSDFYNPLAHWTSAFNLKFRSLPLLYQINPDQSVWFIDLDKYFTEIYSQMSNLQYSNIGSDNGLVPTRQQAIIWTNDDYFTDAYMRHSASMS